MSDRTRFRIVGVARHTSGAHLITLRKLTRKVVFDANSRVGRDAWVEDDHDQLSIPCTPHAARLAGERIGQDVEGLAISVEGFLVPV